ncbi:MAG: hypothetical protein AB8B97_26295 [Granulosicoccus sp.]
MPEPIPGEVAIHHKPIGLDCTDVYFRSGWYPIEQFPTIVGMEGAPASGLLGS